MKLLSQAFFCSTIVPMFIILLYVKFNLAEILSFFVSLAPDRASIMTLYHCSIAIAFFAGNYSRAFRNKTTCTFFGSLAPQIGVTGTWRRPANCQPHFLASENDVFLVTATAVKTTNGKLHMSIVATALWILLENLH